MASTFDAISVYGQDTRILESWYSRQNPEPITIPTPSQQGDVPRSEIPSRCIFLSIPLELRQQIYTYILPNTHWESPNSSIWLRGCTAILATNSQIHAECSWILYSTNTFVIKVAYDSVTFAYKWIQAGGLTPKQRLPFPERIGNRYIQFLRRIAIYIYHFDEYSAMVKYNCSGSALTDGLRDRVRSLCQCLARIPQIDRLSILIVSSTFEDRAYTCQTCERVLEPFLNLGNVRSCQVEGDLWKAYINMVPGSLKSNLEKRSPSFLCLPLEIRQQIYHTLLDSFQHNNSSPYKLTGQDEDTSRGHGSLSDLIALSWTSFECYSEIQSFIFKNTHFRLSISADLEYRLELQQYSPTAKRRVKSRPILLFPQGIYTPALANLRSLSIYIDRISLSPISPRYRELENFFDILVSFLMTASLQNLYVEYASDKKSSSGDSTTSRLSPIDPMIGYVRSLNTSPDLRPIRLKTSLPNTVTSRSSIYSAESIHTQLTTSLPMSMDETSLASNVLLQTPLISNLVSKLNPIMARIKNREDGHVGFIQHGNTETKSRLKLADLRAARSLTETSNGNSGVRQTELMAVASAATTFRSTPRTQSPQPPSSRESSSSRSSTKRNRSRDMLLFPDVPI